MHRIFKSKYNMKKFIVLSGILLAGITASLSAQTPQEADTLFKAKKYTQALDAYKKLLKTKPKTDLYNFRTALCAYELKDYDQATTYFLKTGDKFPLKNYYLGEIYFDSYRFDESLLALTTYLQTFNPEDTQITAAQRKLKQAELGAKFLKRVEDVVITDSLVVDKKDFLSKLPLSPDLGSLTQSRLTLRNGTVTDKVEYITQRGDRSCFSDTLRGQSDLFAAYKLLDKWAPAEKLTGINTPDNENYPFLMLDGVTLYFASDGEGSLGGYDIFVTRFNTTTNSWLAPENAGMPFNSPFNDYMMVIDEVRHTGWFVSDRYQPAGKVAIYQFTPNMEKKIIRTENRDSLIRYARAQQITRTGFNKTIKTPEEVNQTIKPTAISTIIINDTLSYSGTDQFRNPDARKSYLELEQLQADAETTKSQLNAARTKYALAADENSKKNVGETILALEHRLRELEPRIKELTLRWRNEEIKFLQNSLKSGK